MAERLNEVELVCHVRVNLPQSTASLHQIGDPDVPTERDSFPGGRVLDLENVQLSLRFGRQSRQLMSSRRFARR